MNSSGEEGREKEKEREREVEVGKSSFFFVLGFLYASIVCK